MTFYTRKLGELIHVKHGFAFASQYFADAGPYVLLTPGNFHEAGGFKFRDAQKFYDGPVPDEFVLDPGDLLVAMTEQGEGLLGSAAFVPSGLPCLHNQRLGLVQAREGAPVDLRYIYYLFNSRPVRQQIRASATGAKIRHTAPTRIANVDVPIANFPEQQRIAEILGAYDELIAVNRRRVALLEEMARSLFEEWFVRFRFPGHEGVEIAHTVQGAVPSGWSTKTVGEAFEITGGGTPSKAEKDYWTEGLIDWYTPTDLTRSKTLFMDGSALKISPLGLQRSSATLFPADSVMMTSRATLGVISICSGPATTNQGFITCLPNENVPRTFLFYWLQHNVDVFVAHATGATFKEITKGVFKRLPILVPPAGITAQFEGIARPLHDLILALERASRKLTAARDLLLPRLISGQLSVAQAELELAQAA